MYNKHFKTKNSAFNADVKTIFNYLDKQVLTHKI